MAKSAKIRKLLAKNLSAGEIAKQLKVPANYVHTVKWLDKKNKKNPSKIIKAVTEVKQALDVIKKKPTKLIVQPQHKDTAMKLLAELDAAEKKPQRVMINLARRKDGAIIDLNKGGEVISPPDLVNKPPHYTAGGMDFLDYAEAKGLTENAYLFNVVKYVSRAGKKVGVDPVQDLEKAEFYLKREIARRKKA